MRSHWWWRPGWRPGRRQYAWHLTFGEQAVSRGRAGLRRVVGHYQARLAGLPGLDLVPVEWLHLTVQTIGFADEVGPGDAERIVAAVRGRCAALAPLRLTLGPAVLQAEGVWLPVAPQAAVRRVRAAVRAGIAEVWGGAAVGDGGDRRRPGDLAAPRRPPLSMGHRRDGAARGRGNSWIARNTVWLG
jgi:hypothetical protein